MTRIAPGWYKDPADTSTQRYWDGDGWLGDPLPVDAAPPDGPPPVAETPPAPPSKTAPSSKTAAPSKAAPPPEPAHPEPAHPEQAPVLPPGPPFGPPLNGIPRGMPYPYPQMLPAPRPHGLPLATPGARFLARLFDITAVVLLNVLGNGWLAYQWWTAVEPAARAAWRTGATDAAALPDKVGWLQFAILFVGLALWFAYEVPAVAATGQTLGKRIIGIKVMRLESPDPLGFGRSMRRWNRMGLPTVLWLCCGVGLILQAVDCLFVAIDRPLRQAIHDKAALTVVVNTRAPNPTTKAPAAR